MGAEEPKIDAGLKSFYSWWVPIKQQEQQQQQQQKNLQTSWNGQIALSCTRCLSKAINNHIMAIQMTKTDTIKNNQDGDFQDLIVRVWNEQAGTPGAKITKQLGRTSLAVAWRNANSNNRTAKNNETEQIIMNHEIKAEALQMI